MPMGAMYHAPRLEQLGQKHPDYTDPAVVIGGMMSHIFYTVPMALCVRRLMHKGVRNA